MTVPAVSAITSAKQFGVSEEWQLGFAAWASPNKEPDDAQDRRGDSEQCSDRS